MKQSLKQRLTITADIASKIKDGQVSTSELLEFITNPRREVRDINERIISAMALLDRLNTRAEYLTSSDSKKILATITDEYNYPCEGLNLSNTAVIDHNHLNFKFFLCRIIAKHSRKMDLNDKEFRSFAEFIKFAGILKDIYGSFHLIDVSSLKKDLESSRLGSFTI